MKKLRRSVVTSAIRTGLLGLPGLAILLAGILASCSSSDGSGGSCSNFAGQYHGESSCSDGSKSTVDVTLTQNGCNLTVKDKADGSTSTGTASGTTATFPVDQGGYTGSCTATLKGDAYTRSCSASDGKGSTVTCDETGARTGAPGEPSTGDAGTGAGGSGAGGSGASGGKRSGSGGSLGGGSGGRIGAGGSVSGSGGKTSSGSGGAGAGDPLCGLDWSEEVSCDACMTGSCCAELEGCAPGTPCANLVDCASTSCPTFDPGCLQTACAAELKSGTPALSALSDCNDKSCQGCN